jgi:tetratricopeptide (TPR) repeat protein
MMKNIFILTILLAVCPAVFGQIDYTRQFENGKQLYREGKYNLAMETFKPLIPYDQNNRYAEYAAFYYALAAYQQGYAVVAKDQLLQIKSLYPKWDKLDDVNLWLGKIYMDQRDYFQGLKVLSTIQDKKFEGEIEGIKAQALKNVTDVETLKMMREEHPKDQEVVRALAKALSRNLGDPQDKALLENLIAANNLKKEAYIPTAPKTFFKDIYSVSVMMPFMVSTLDPSPVKKRNQIVLDFYEGMKLAADTLNKQSIKISLRAYDTERDNNKTKNLLNTEEIKNTDLIVGPFFQEENKIIQDFSRANKINVINPFTNNTEFISQNPYGFLYQPSFETIGKKSAEFLAAQSRKKNCIVFLGTTRRDSVLAANFVKAASEKGLKILAQKEIGKDNIKSILNYLATPTEYDEFKYPKEFTLKKDSVGSIFVASDDPLIYTKVLSGVETRNDNILVLGSENWMEQTAFDIEKFETLNIRLAAPNFTPTSDPRYQLFLRKFIKTHGRIPSVYAKMGYELMWFMGHQLKENGVYFQEAFNEHTTLPGYLIDAYNFQFERNNQFVHFIGFDEGTLKIIDKR